MSRHLLGQRAEHRNQLPALIRAHPHQLFHVELPRHFQLADEELGAKRRIDGAGRRPLEGHERVDRLAIDALVAFQRATAGSVNPPFSAEFFIGELEMTREFYVEKLMGVSADESRKLIPMFGALAEKVSRHPYLLCHRDYHGQNIHILNGALYLIDYQDLRMGPDTYDLASLLRDRGVARILGEQTEMELLAYYGGLRGS